MCETCQFTRPSGPHFQNSAATCPDLRQPPAQNFVATLAELRRTPFAEPLCRTSRPTSQKYVFFASKNPVLLLIFIKTKLRRRPFSPSQKSVFAFAEGLRPPSQKPFATTFTDHISHLRFFIGNMAVNEVSPASEALVLHGEDEVCMASEKMMTTSGSCVPSVHIRGATEGHFAPHSRIIAVFEHMRWAWRPK